MLDNHVIGNDVHPLFDSTRSLPADTKADGPIPFRARGRHHPGFATLTSVMCNDMCATKGKQDQDGQDWCMLTIMTCNKCNVLFIAHQPL
eukprot:351879-Chlamydomonas_euryale.AAC.18